MEQEPQTHNESQANAIKTFIEITSSTPQEALFFLESFNYDLDSALSTFLENHPNPNLNSPPIDLNSEPVVADEAPVTFRSESVAPAPVPVVKKEKRKGSGSRSGRIKTLSDLRGGSGDGSDSDEEGHGHGHDHGDAPQEYYTGGQKSGMLVQAPPKSNDVDSIFDQARQLGATERTLEDLPQSSSSRSFAGTGRLLSGESVAAAPPPPQDIVHTIMFWRNGFTVNDGPLRRIDDPENAPFLESIKKSECPKELEPANRNSKISLSLGRREEDCPEPEVHHIPFQGVGRTLGSSTPTASEATVSAPLNSAPAPSVGLFVDPELPATSIQLRLSDGTRMVARFNFHHTVNDIRSFIDASRPGGSRSYQLQTMGFPPKQLNDATQTIEQAGLANSVVVQRS